MRNNNILDLIIYMAKRIRVGDTLTEIKSDSLNHYNSSEISAAYSWILQKHPAVTEHKKKDFGKYHRVLHFAERMLISSEAYGYLLEMVNIGLLDNREMEQIIERVMFQSSEPIDIDKVRKIVHAHVFDTDSAFRNHNNMLRGNETIN